MGGEGEEHVGAHADPVPYAYMYSYITKQRDTYRYCTSEFATRSPRASWWPIA